MVLSFNFPSPSRGMVELHVFFSLLLSPQSSVLSTQTALALGSRTLNPPGPYRPGQPFRKASRFELQALTPEPGTLVLDSRDRLLRLGADAQGRRVMLLPPGPLPEMVVAAFLAAEDGRFRQHYGIDVKAVVRAAWSNLRAGRVVSGASTITQQLARLAYPAPRTYYHKLVEMLRSLRLEAALSKDEILRCYLNLTPQGNNLMGVETASRVYFDKSAAHLTPPEAAVLAALAKAPGRLNPLGPHRQKLSNRRDWVLARLAQLGFLSVQESAAARQTGLKVRSGDLFPFEAPHFVNLVQAETETNAHGSIHTTLDLNLHRRAQAIVLSHRSRLQKGGVSQAAAVIIKNRSMEVVALVGSFHYGARDQGFNNGATARRSPGSTLKPFLYGRALDLGFNPAHVLEDVDGRYRTPRGEFIPANFDRVAHGPISMREALGNSLNLSAVSLLNQVGPPAFYDLLTRLQLINHPERPRTITAWGWWWVIPRSVSCNWPPPLPLSPTAAFIVRRNLLEIRSLQASRSRFFLPRPPTSSATSWPTPWPGPVPSAPPWP